MSCDLYWTRLYWANGKGVAKENGCIVVLRESPLLLGQRFDNIDYAPEVSVYLVRPHFEKEREMTLEERAAARGFLDRIGQGEQP